MHILMVSDVSLPSSEDEINDFHFSGAERVLLEEMQALEVCGNKISLIARGNQKNQNSKYKFKGITVYTFFADPSFPADFIYRTISGPRSIFNKIAKDVDIINFYQPFSAFSLTLQTKYKYIPRVYTCLSLGHAEYAMRNNIEGRGNKFTDRVIVIPFMKAIEKFNFSKSSVIRTLSLYSSQLVKDICNVPDSKIRVISGGVDTVRFNPGGNKKDCRKKFSFPEDKIILTTLRNLEPRMGIDNLLYAVKEVSKTHDGISLIIGGEGPLRNKLERIVRDEALSAFVKFAGFIDEKDLPDFYRASDFFILPTAEQEGFGLVTVESLGCGTPVIGTPVGATPEILCQVNPELVLKTYDSKGIAEGIIKWIAVVKNNRPLYDAVSMQGIELVRNKYGWDKVAKELEGLYREFL